MKQIILAALIVCVASSAWGAMWQAVPPSEKYKCNGSIVQVAHETPLFRELINVTREHLKVTRELLKVTRQLRDEMVKLNAQSVVR